MARCLYICACESQKADFFDEKLIFCRKIGIFVSQFFQRLKYLNILTVIPRSSQILQSKILFWLTVSAKNGHFLYISARSWPDHFTNPFELAFFSYGHQIFAAIFFPQFRFTLIFTNQITMNRRNRYKKKVK